MPDAAPAAAAPTTATPSQSNPQQTARPATPQPAAPKAPAKAEAPAADKPTWGDDDKKQLFDLLKKSPYKLRHKGEEQALDSEESFTAALMDAQRGRGASKMVEETKREKAEAEKARTEAQRMSQLLEAARRGDVNALSQLGLEPPDVRQQREADEAAIPPEVRAVIDENRRLAAELQRREAAAHEAQQRQEQELVQKQAAELREVGMGYAKKLVEAIGADPKHAAEAFEDIRDAMMELNDLGAEIGVDFTEDQVLAMARQRREARALKDLSQLRPERLFSSLKDNLMAAKPADMRAALGDDGFTRFATSVARELKAMRLGPAPTQPQQTQPAPEEKPKSAGAGWPLSPFRFGGR
jgi:hypothetical protein